MSKRRQRDYWTDHWAKRPKYDECVEKSALKDVFVRNGDDSVVLREEMAQKRQGVGNVSKELEVLRYCKMEELRQYYKELCKRMLHWDHEPKSSFNRFLTDHLLEKQSSSEPLLPKEDDISGDLQSWVSSTRIYQEIEEDYPAKIKPPVQFVKGWHKMKTHLSQYIEGCTAVEQNFPMTEDNQRDLTAVIRRGNDLLTAHSTKGSFTELRNNYANLRTDSAKVLQQILSPVTSELVILLLRRSSEFASQIQQQSLVNTQSNDPVVRATNKETSMTTFEYDSKQFRISHETEERLGSLFRFNNANATDNDVNEAIFILLARYNSFIGSDFGAGGLQAALPRKLFYRLNRDFDVTMECFASPLNSYFSTYCSAFFDSDSSFGSVGSFFDFYPVRGSFEANPPFCEKLMDKMVEHMEDLLGSSDEPLSFIVVVPSWDDASAYQSMQKSKFFRKLEVIPGREHYYKSGLQHEVNQHKKLYYAAVHDTSVFFLQNEAGHRTWTPTHHKLDNLNDAFHSTNDSY